MEFFDHPFASFNTHPPLVMVCPHSFHLQCQVGHRPSSGVPQSRARGNSACSISLCSNWALEGEVVAVGVGDGEAEHVVDGSAGLLQHGDVEGKKLVEGGVHVGAAEEERGVGRRPCLRHGRRGGCRVRLLGWNGFLKLGDSSLKFREACCDLFAGKATGGVFHDVRTLARMQLEI